MGLIVGHHDGHHDSHHAEITPELTCLTLREVGTTCRLIDRDKRNRAGVIGHFRQEKLRLESRFVDQPDKVAWKFVFSCGKCRASVLPGRNN